MPDTIENQLLAALPRENYTKLVRHLEPVSLSSGKILFEPGESIQQVYFPHSAMVSILSVTKDGETIEVGMVGYEGMVGIPLILGDTSPYRALVQIAGKAMKMRSEILKEEFKRQDALHNLLLRYTNALLIQISQSGVCNRFHTVEQRFCRWLLVAHDRAKSDKLLLTQDFISHMLGTRRASVTVAAGALKRAGLIKLNRGEITILDREGLESACCECYGIVKSQFGRVFSKIP